MDWTFGHETDARYQEILRLAGLMRKAGIPHQLRKVYEGWQILYPSLYGVQMDVAQHRGTGGSLNDRVELMGLKSADDDIGPIHSNLKAEQALKIIQQHYNEHKREMDTLAVPMPISAKEE